MIPFLDSTSMIYMHWVRTGQTINKEYYVEVLREFRKRFRRKKVSTLQIGSVAFPAGQCTSPQLHSCHRLFEQDGQFLSLPMVQTLLHVTFAYSLSSRKNLRGCRYETIEEMKEERGCDEGHWHAHTRRLPWGLSEVVVTVQQMHCSRRLLRRVLGFHVCTINKSAHSKKKSGNLFCALCTYIYIYIHTLISKLLNHIIDCKW